MKALNKFITEKLKITKNIKILSMSEKEIIDYICILWGFVPSETGDKAMNECIEIIKRWIDIYHISKVSTGYFCGGERDYFNSLYTQVEKYLGKDKAKSFKYIPDKSIDDVESYKNGNKEKITGYDTIFITHNENEIAIISDADFLKEARVVQV